MPSSQLPQSFVKVAAVQAASKGYDLPGSLAKVAKFSAQAKEQGASLVVFPEAFLSAYPRHIGFKVGSRSESDRVWHQRYVQSAVKIPPSAFSTGLSETEASSIASEGDFAAFQTLCDIAEKHGIYLSIGIIERSLVGSTLWCTSVLFSPEGKLLSRHRKLQPTAAERIVWSQGHARNPESAAIGGDDNMAVVQTEIGRIGGLICWENFMPLARYALYKKGVEIYTAPTADGRDTWLPSMQHIAQEGRCYVISANQYQTREDFPEDYPCQLDSGIPNEAGGKLEKSAWCRGGSSIVGPLGQVLAGPLWDEEGIIFAEIDIDALHGARLDFDPVGHYARAELLEELITS